MQKSHDYLQMLYIATGYVYIYIYFISMNGNIDYIVDLFWEEQMSEIARHVWKYIHIILH